MHILLYFCCHIVKYKISSVHYIYSNCIFYISFIYKKVKFKFTVSVIDINLISIFKVKIRHVGHFYSYIRHPLEV